MPDVGSTYFLTKFFARPIGYFISLLGAKLTLADMAYTNIATHFCDNLTDLRNILIFNDISSLIPYKITSSNSNKFGTSVLEKHNELINAIFCGSLDFIFQKLKFSSQNDPIHSKLCSAWLDQLSSKSPLSLVLTMHAFDLDPASIVEALKNEFRATVRIGRGLELKKGVRALLIEKVKPVWTKLRNEITLEEIESYFKPFIEDIQTKDIVELSP